jgi:hypothetical protein
MIRHDWVVELGIRVAKGLLSIVIHQSAVVFRKRCQEMSDSRKEVNAHRNAWKLISFEGYGKTQDPLSNSRSDIQKWRSNLLALLDLTRAYRVNNFLKMERFLQYL